MNPEDLDASKEKEEKNLDETAEAPEKTVADKTQDEFADEQESVEDEEMLDEDEDEDEEEEEDLFENIDFRVEKTAACTYKIAVKVQKERVTKEIEESFKDLNFNVQIDGFRKGKVPRWLLEKRFGAEIQEELKNRFKALALQYIRDELSYQLLTEPEIEEKQEKVEKNADYEFDVSFETQPEIELKPFSDIKIERKKIEIKDEKIDEIFFNPYSIWTILPKTCWRVWIEFGRFEENTPPCSNF